MAKLHEGDKVSFRTVSGRIKGKVTEVKTEPFQLSGATIKADEKDPRYIVTSKKTGTRTSHTAGGLKKR